MVQPVSTFVVPGFCGTALSFRGGTGGKTQVWANPTNLLRYTPMVMALAADGISPLPPFGKTLFPDGPVQLGIYEPLLTQLSNDQLSPLFCGYDWRVDPRTSAANLANLILNTPRTDPFYVVAHSFGGIIAQLAYPLYRAKAANGTWATTAYLGTPHGGAYSAAANLGGMYSAGDWTVFLADILKVIAKQNKPALAVTTAAGVVMSKTVASWPALYSLLPSNLGPWQGLDQRGTDFLALATYASGPGNVQQQWLTLALAVQQAIVAGLAQPRPAEVCFLGDDLPTLDGLVRPDAMSYNNAWSRALEGDSTVLITRGTLPNVGKLTFTRTTHQALTTSLGPLTALAGALKNPPTGDSIKANYALEIVNPPSSSAPTFPPVVDFPFVNVFMDP